MFMNAAELHETWIDLPRGAPITVGNFGDQILLEPSYRLLNGQLVDLGRADARIDRPGHQDHAAGLRRIAVFRVDARKRTFQRSHSPHRAASIPHCSRAM
jgi:hypothetical protein